MESSPVLWTSFRSRPGVRTAVDCLAHEATPLAARAGPLAGLDRGQASSCSAVDGLVNPLEPFEPLANPPTLIDHPAHNVFGACGARSQPATAGNSPEKFSGGFALPYAKKSKAI